MELTDTVRGLNPRDFLMWCHERERERVVSDQRYSFLLGSCQNQEWVWAGSQLKAAVTQIVHRQQHANLPEASIQSVNTKALSFDGLIDWPTKARALDQVGILHPRSVFSMSVAGWARGLDISPRAVVS